MKFSPSQKLKISLIVLSFSIFSLPIFIFAAPSKLVIDEYRVSGENSNDEYVVIANYGFTAINLNNYRLVKRAKSTTDYKLVDNFGDFTLNPGQKLVAAHAKYSGIKDFTFYTGSSNTVADNNSIYLLAPDKSIVDLAGYGDAVYYESSPAPTPSVGEVYSRTDGIDTDNNLADFSLQKTAIPVDLNASNLVISELLPSPATGEEWFELYNPTNQDVSLENLKICDALGSRHCYFFEDSDTILAGSYKTYVQSVTKITLNNTGDWLELYDVSDNLITDSGGNYGAADKGISLSLFGSEYRWTKIPTPAATNVFLDTIEIEVDAKPAAKSTSKSKVVTATKKTIVATTLPASGQIQDAEAGVEAATDTVVTTPVEPKTMIGRKELGWGLIGLAILLVLGYICWYFRNYAKEIYDKIRHRDDSARF